MRPRIGSMRVCHLIAAVLFNVQAYAQEAPRAPASAKRSAPEGRLETVAVISDRTPVKAGDHVVATVEKDRMFGVIQRRGDLVEIQVCVGTKIHRATLQVSQVKFLTDTDIDLAGEWLKMPKDLDPKMDVPAYRAKLNALIDRAAAAAAPGKNAREKARLIAVEVFQREGFTTKRAVKRPDRLLDLKQGDCSGFSFLYLCIAQRLRFPLFLVTAPDHAFVRFEDRAERFNIETTQEGKLHDTDDYLREYLGSQRFSQVAGTHLASLPLPRALGVLFVNWGAALAEMGKYPEACEKYARAGEINPRYAEAYSNWGAGLGEMRKGAEACEKFAKAVEINPRLAGPYFNWGVALAGMGKAAEACNKYAKAVEINPRYAGAYYNWALALEAMGKVAGACEKYAKAVEINPRLAEAYSNWGVALAGIGKAAEACEKFAKAVAINPRLAEGYSNWGNTLCDIGKTADACGKYAKAVEINPRYAEAYYNWGRALCITGKVAEACEKYAKAVEINPRFAGAYYNWGLALAQLSKNPQAIEKLEKAAKIDPTLRAEVQRLRADLERSE